MPEPEGLTPAQRELESALKSLAPAMARVDPVAAAFIAGRRSSQFQVHVWRAAAAIILLIGAVAVLMPPMRSSTVPALVAVPTPSPAFVPVSGQVVLALWLSVRETCLNWLAPGPI